MRRYIKYFRQTLAELAHGIFLKAMALLGRGVFLIFVIPRLSDGTLAHYVYLSSIAALAGRVLALGLEEQFPLVIAGRHESLRQYISLTRFLFIVQVSSATLYLLTSHAGAITLLLAVCYVNTSVLAGMIRTVNVSGSERLRDLHWVIFACLTLFPVQWNTNQLLGLISVSLMIVQIAEYRVTLRLLNDIRAQSGRLAGALLRLIRVSWKKLFAGAALLAVVRGIIIWPNLLGLNLDALDSIAYALLLGEAFWQTAMVLVFRRYAHYCRLGRTAPMEIYRDSIPVVGVIIVYATAAAGLMIALKASGFSLVDFSEWNVVAQMILFFGAVASYLLIRYIIWILKDFDWVLIGLEIGLFLSEGIIINTLDQDRWPLAIAIAASTFLIIAFAYMRFIVTSAVGKSDMNRNGDST